MLLIQKLGRALLNISGMLILMAALVIWPGSAMAEEALPAEAASDAKSAPCKGLKPYNRICWILEFGILTSEYPNITGADNEYGEKPN